MGKDRNLSCQLPGQNHQRVKAVEKLGQGYEGFYPETQKSMVLVVWTSALQNSARITFQLLGQLVCDRLRHL